jgi:hypothetical protein
VIKNIDYSRRLGTWNVYDDLEDSTIAQCRTWNNNQRRVNLIHMKISDRTLDVLFVGTSPLIKYISNMEHRQEDRKMEHLRVAKGKETG